MSDNTSSKTKKVVLIAGGALVIAGAAWYFMRPKKEEEQVVFSTKPKPAATTTAATGATTTTTTTASRGWEAAAPRSETPGSAPTSEGNLMRTETTMMVNEYSFDPSNVTQPHDKPKVYVPPVADANGTIYFETIGVKIQQTRGWTIAEETSPMPNVAMLSFSKAEYAERGGSGMPGEVPVVLLSIEDISNESISVDEFRAKSKHMAITQMQMMTNGMFEPNVTEDSKLSAPIGPFTHILMYELRTPYFSMQVDESHRRRRRSRVHSAAHVQRQRLQRGPQGGRRDGEDGEDRPQAAAQGLPVPVQPHCHERRRQGKHPLVVVRREGRGVEPRLPLRHGVPVEGRARRGVQHSARKQH
jgi:hypothetical protein